MGKRINKSAKKNQAKAPRQSLAAPDTKKRLFLKFLGIAGLGFVGSLLVPKRADALVFGSTPTSNVIGVKNAANARVNPATEDTLATLATQATVAGIKTGTDNLAAIKTDVDTLTTAGGGGYIRQDTTATIAKETGGNLAAIKTNTDKFTFDVDGNLLTAGASGGSASAVGIKDALENRITPAQDDSIVLLRRMVKVMESQATVDTANRQRVTIDALGVIGATMPVSGTVTATVSSAAITTLAGQNQQMYQDAARNAYANGIRQNLTFS